MMAEIIITTGDTNKMVNIELFGGMENAEFVESNKLLERSHSIRYIATDYEYSGYDIYEEISTGYLYATKL